MISVPLRHVFSYVLTKAFFIAFTLVLLIQMESFLNRRSAKPAFALSAVFAVLATLTRYLGASADIRRVYGPGKSWVGLKLNVWGCK